MKHKGMRNRAPTASRLLQELKPNVGGRGSLFPGGPEREAVACHLHLRFVPLRFRCLVVCEADAPELRTAAGWPLLRAKQP